MRAGRIANIQLVLNNWFLALIAVFALAGMAGKVLLIFSCVLWHEAAHALTARCLGLKVREIELLPFGGVARIESLNQAGHQAEMFIAAAGPASSLLLAVLALPACRVPEWADVARFYFDANATLAVFNMLPALPLDGGRIVRAWMAAFVSYEQATRLLAVFTHVITFLMLLFVLLYFTSTGTLHLSLLFAAILLFLAARREEKTMRYRVMNLLAQKKASLMAKGAMQTVHITAIGSALARDVVNLFEPDRYGLVQVLDEGCRPKGNLTETEVWENLPQRGANARIDEFLGI